MGFKVKWNTLIAQFKLLIYRSGLAWPYSSTTVTIMGTFTHHSTIQNDVNSTAEDTDCVKIKQMIIRLRQLLKTPVNPIQVPEGQKSPKCCSLGYTLFDNERRIIVINE